MTQPQVPVVPDSQAATDSAAVLLNMLRTRRPGGSKTERAFIKQYLLPLGLLPDKMGNYILRIGDKPILWSCHTDTVHRMGGTQELTHLGNMVVGITKESGSNCLGADDTAGIWLMREMILAKVQGLYVFHRNEERGCVGSKWIAKNTPKLFDGIKFAVALDRKGQDEVITHQHGRCCSDEFAESMAAQLGMGYAPSNRGVYTDTAEYTGLIGECTNLSVGYLHQHTKDEVLDCAFLLRLRDKLCNIDVDKLVSKRKPGEVEPYKYTSHHYDGDYYGGYDSSWYDNWEWSTALGTYVPKDKKPVTQPEKFHLKQGCDHHRGAHTWLWNAAKGYHEYKYDVAFERKSNVQPSYKTKTSAAAKVKKPGTIIGKIRGFLTSEDEQYFNGTRGKITMEGMVRNHPEVIADLLEQYGITVTEVEEQISQTLGYVRY